MDYEILSERPDDAALIDPLLDRTFGPERMTKTVYRLREMLPPVPELGFSAVDPDGHLLGSIRYWPILIEGTPAILLGPLAVEPRLQGRGIGKALVRHSLRAARQAGHRICVVVGEPEYYGPFGFRPAAEYGLILPGPVDPRRFQAQELAVGALEGVRGLIARAEVPVSRKRPARRA
ncbi:Predicted N-acetyltransferase YhbS [Tistlia consotensis]|uniref:Predicted N-acetyltransferase YhbS n=1 Tax=Tistlia consotensis USBA 355 TaxID=560819 RepID=A0A1Y6C5I0_9PROT|nr:N-acetyltransferase [Tistlia consotensis]SMF46722.1 Predicted N-acetyltransferase YhbS [Tistlia consotensis USBA 355]SNR78084.1 Predicted N-acetyltransferase YhbS [Tistlia consotensis]